ncbi:MAG: hypothetical protein HRU10_14670 [Opitutales bacterium]|nr:hypothetical protein [Opitutales bacterium]
MNTKAKDRMLKLRYVYLRYILISVATLSTYTGLRRIFDFQLGLLSLKDEALDLFFPLFIAYLVSYLGLRRPLKIYKTSNRSNNRHENNAMLAWLAISCPLIVSQFYVKAAAFELVPIQDVSELRDFPQEKNFEIKNISVDWNTYHYSYSTNTTGKHNEMKWFRTLDRFFCSVKV